MSTHEWQVGERVIIRHPAGIGYSDRAGRVRRVLKRFIEVEEEGGRLTKWSIPTGDPYPYRSGFAKPHAYPCSDEEFKEHKERVLRDTLLRKIRAGAECSYLEELPTTRLEAVVELLWKGED